MFDLCFSEWHGTPSHTIFKMRRDKRNASLEIAMAEKNGNYWKNIVFVKIIC